MSTAEGSAASELPPRPSGGTDRRLTPGWLTDLEACLPSAIEAHSIRSRLSSCGDFVGLCAGAQREWAEEGERRMDWNSGIHAADLLLCFPFSPVLLSLPALPSSIRPNPFSSTDCICTYTCLHPPSASGDFFPSRVFALPLLPFRPILPSLAVTSFCVLTLHPLPIHIAAHLAADTIHRDINLDTPSQRLHTVLHALP